MTGLETHEDTTELHDISRPGVSVVAQSRAQWVADRGRVLAELVAVLESRNFLCAQFKG